MSIRISPPASQSQHQDAQACPQGHAILSLSHEVWRDVGQPDTCEAWQQALHLPTAYAITHIEESNNLNSSLRVGGMFLLTVTSDRFPSTQTGTLPDTFHPYYRRDDKGLVELTKIEVWHWNDEQERWAVSEAPL